MRHTKGRQERGVHYDLWVQRLANSRSSKNKPNVLNCLQWKKFASFAKLLNGKMKQQISAVVAGKLRLQEFKQLYVGPLL